MYTAVVYAGEGRPPLSCCRCPRARHVPITMPQLLSLLLHHHPALFLLFDSSFTLASYSYNTYEHVPSERACKRSRRFRRRWRCDARGEGWGARERDQIGGALEQHRRHQPVRQAVSSRFARIIFGSATGGEVRDTKDARDSMPRHRVH